jgi:CheY-like chemotaxis protein
MISELVVAVFPVKVLVSKPGIPVDLDVQVKVVLVEVAVPVRDPLPAQEKDVPANPELPDLPALAAYNAIEPLRRTRLPASYGRGAQEGKYPFDAVIMDLTIPGSMGGTDAIKRIKRTAPETKGMVSRGYSYDRAISKFREYGFYGVEAKPYTIKDLARVMHNALKGVEG